MKYRSKLVTILEIDFCVLTGALAGIVPILQIAEANKNAHREVSASAWLGIVDKILAAADKLREDRMLQRLAALFELDGQLLTI